MRHNGRSASCKTSIVGKWLSGGIDSTTHGCPFGGGPDSVNQMRIRCQSRAIFLEEAGKLTRGPCAAVVLKHVSMRGGKSQQMIVAYEASGHLYKYAVRVAG